MSLDAEGIFHKERNASDLGYNPWNINLECHASQPLASLLQLERFVGCLGCDTINRR